MAKFKDNLTASFRQIRADRAEGIAEDTEIEYRREIEDRMRRIRQYDRQRENLILDLSPSNITSTQVVPGDFNAAEFKEKDIQIGIEKRNDLIILEIVVDRYEYLFGPYPEIDKIKELIPSFTSKIK
ncbi:MAG: hypothetical protein IKR94_06310 [Bacteroidales bacterium]|nr:hypothetical protein [Bacteroidales bacterium]MBR4214914.1 hypothetical protein [Bacteroidales bacterium]